MSVPKKKKKKKGPLSKEAISLMKWGDQEWRTKSGKNSVPGS